MESNAAVTTESDYGSLYRYAPLNKVFADAIARQKYIDTLEFLEAVITALKV